MSAFKGHRHCFVLHVNYGMLNRSKRIVRHNFDFLWRTTCQCFRCKPDVMAVCGGKARGGDNFWNSWLPRHNFTRRTESMYKMSEIFWSHVQAVSINHTQRRLGAKSLIRKRSYLPEGSFFSPLKHRLLSSPYKNILPKFTAQYKVKSQMGVIVAFLNVHMTRTTTIGGRRWVVWLRHRKSSAYSRLTLNLFPCITKRWLLTNCFVTQPACHRWAQSGVAVRLQGLKPWMLQYM